MEREEAELRALQQEEAALQAANKRITTMAEELRKAELVRDRSKGWLGSWAPTRKATTCVRAWRRSMWSEHLRGLTKTFRIMTDALLYPGGT